MAQNTPLPLARQRPTRSAGAILRTVGTGGTRWPTPARSLYIHVPFCFHKCHYCDFYSIVDTRDRQPAFVDRLIRELGALAPYSGGEPLKTIFVGGGTPSLLRPDLWQLLLAAMRDRFNLSEIVRGTGEFTVECNPETVTDELISTLVQGGVNRVSMGAQSFNPAHLKTLERWHDPASVAKALDVARRGGVPRRSLDLIFAIPGQTLDDWRCDLRAALDLGTTHLSCYDLTYEPNTAMTARRNRGEFSPAPEDLEIEMFEETLRAVRAKGLERYEVSNFARPGDEARHNLAYWRQEAWLAAGPSASGHFGGHRWKNSPRLDDYLSCDDDGFAPIADHEGPDPVRALSERIMTGLRLAEGLDRRLLLSAASALPGGSRSDGVWAAAERFVRSGHLTVSEERWILSDSGFLIADAVAGEMMAALGG